MKEGGKEMLELYSQIRLSEPAGLREGRILLQLNSRVSWNPFPDFSPRRLIPRLSMAGGREQRVDHA